MNNKKPQAVETAKKTRIERAEARAEQAETRTEQAKTRTEQAETRIEQAKTRIEQAETRTEQAETRTELAKTRTDQAEAALQRWLKSEADPGQEILARPHKKNPEEGSTGRNGSFAHLTSRQREVLQFIAEGQTTKQIAGILAVSPKTIEYHRMKLMDGLKVHDIPGLVRLALRAGLIPPES